uniref:Fibronectin type-III domain-containing protein n=1 Tax=Musca domestica TaxID=7370 RepID=A0A1I8MC88_MUSDO
MKCSSNRFSANTIGSTSSMCSQLQQTVTLLLMATAFCAISVVGSPTQQPQQLQKKEQLELHNHHTTAIRVQQCRDGCLEKFSTKSPLCQKMPKCSMCLNECIHRDQSKATSSIRETWSLRTVSMVQHDSLVLVDVAWEQSSTPFQCLVTWEVSGGGLMGNLLTESFGVQLSLWPDTKYRVQVTCKNKRSGLMSRSLPLVIDTSEAIKIMDSEEKLVPTGSNSIFTKELATSNPLTVPLTSSSNFNDAIVDTNAVSFEDQIQSDESDGQPDNSLFVWNPDMKNADIASIEPLRPLDLDLLASLTKSHRPLLYAMVAVIILLVLIIIFCACSLRSPRQSEDKVMLIAENHNINRRIDSKSKCPHFPGQLPEVSCTSQATCSRHIPRV